MSEKIEINTLITEVGKLVSLLNELVTKCHKLEGELEESSAFIIEQRKENKTLKEENEHLQESYEICKKMLSETIEENELLECKWGVYNVHRLKKDYEQLKKENEKIQEEIKELKIERDDWKSSTCSYMKKDSILSMDCQIVQEALWELEKEIEFGSKIGDLFFDLKEKFEKLNNHRIGVLEK